MLRIIKDKWKGIDKMSFTITVCFSISCLVWLSIILFILLNYN